MNYMKIAGNRIIFTLLLFFMCLMSLLSNPSLSLNPVNLVNPV
jgi:hypothetical protein